MMLGLIKLDFPTFKAFCEKIKLVFLMNEDTTEAKKGIFKMMDKDGDGTLSKKEFKRMMKQYLEVSIFLHNVLQTLTSNYSLNHRQKKALVLFWSTEIITTLKTDFNII